MKNKEQNRRGTQGGEGRKKKERGGIFHQMQSCRAGLFSMTHGKRREGKRKKRKKGEKEKKRGEKKVGDLVMILDLFDQSKNF